MEKLLLIMFVSFRHDHNQRQLSSKLTIITMTIRMWRKKFGELIPKSLSAQKMAKNHAADPGVVAVAARVVVLKDARVARAEAAAVPAAKAAAAVPKVVVPKDARVARAEAPVALKDARAAVVLKDARVARTEAPVALKDVRVAAAAPSEVAKAEVEKKVEKKSRSRSSRSKSSKKSSGKRSRGKKGSKKSGKRSSSRRSR
jgi:hypothetical protein